MYLPMVVLEELDAHKKGLSEASRNVRQVSRFLDDMMRDVTKEQIDRGLQLPSGYSGNHGKKPSTGRLFFQTRAAVERAARGPARPGRRQHHPRADARAAEGAPRRARHPGVQGHQPAHQGGRARRARRGLLQRQDARGLRRPLQRHDGAADRLLGAARQGHALLEGSRPHLLRDHRTGGARVAAEPGRVRGHRRGHRRHRAQDQRRHRHHRADARLSQRAPQRLGHHGAQPRAELRAQPADGSGDRFRHRAGTCRHRQDAAGARRRA